MHYAWAPHSHFLGHMQLHLDRRLPHAVRKDLRDILSGDNPGLPLAKQLECLDGVVSVSIDDYTVTIEKGKLFAWSAVQPAIVDVVGTYFNEPMEAMEFPDAAAVPHTRPTKAKPTKAKPTKAKPA